MKGRDGEVTQKRDIEETVNGKGGDAVVGPGRAIHGVSEARVAFFSK
jgi:hypothetical protein